MPSNLIHFTHLLNRCRMYLSSFKLDLKEFRSCLYMYVLLWFNILSYTIMIWVRTEWLNILTIVLNELVYFQMLRTGKDCYGLKKEMSVQFETVWECSGSYKSVRKLYKSVSDRIKVYNIAPIRKLIPLILFFS